MGAGLLELCICITTQVRAPNPVDEILLSLYYSWSDPTVALTVISRSLAQTLENNDTVRLRLLDADKCVGA